MLCTQTPPQWEAWAWQRQSSPHSLQPESGPRRHEDPAQPRGSLLLLLSCQVGSVSLRTPWTAARQASLSFTTSLHLLKLMPIESVMPSNHLLCCPLLLPSIFPSIRVFCKESALCIRWPKYWGRETLSMCLSTPGKALINGESPSYYAWYKGDKQPLRYARNLFRASASKSQREESVLSHGYIQCIP